ncbi:MAG: hypothetical protein GWN86_27710 [Desulfobacterales bacterium]|nr:hypothetical protein [Desulfobacterales bacterium]
MNIRKDRAHEQYQAFKHMLRNKRAKASALKNEVKVLQRKTFDAAKEIADLEKKRDAYQEELDNYYYKELEWLKHYKHPMRVTDVKDATCFLAEILGKAGLRVIFPIEIRGFSVKDNEFVFTVKEPLGREEHYHLFVHRYNDPAYPIPPEEEK